MANKRLSEKATMVVRGYGQVEPNHLSARRTGQIYAQLPADKTIEVLENGQFAYYDYTHGVVTFGKATNLNEGETAKGKVEYNGEEIDYAESKGEPMLVLNEIKLYKDREQYEDFAMIKSNYNARVYSLVGQPNSDLNKILSDLGYREGSTEPFNLTNPALTESPRMPEGTTMVPRLLRTYVGDIFTTNTVVGEIKDFKVGDILKIDADGYLNPAGTSDMEWQIVKIYTLADNQPAVKIQRIA